jgi:RNA polymerase sigma-70 factor (ECF subfamily)
MQILSGFRNGAEPDGPSDEWLVVRVARGDEAAFARLYDRHARRVYVLAAHMLGPGPAEEIVQDAFVALWRNAHRYDPTRGTFTVWFMAIARHRVLDVLRRRSVEQRLLAAEPIHQLLAETPGSSPLLEDDVLRRHEAGRLLQALAELPPEQRRAVVLAYFAGLTHLEIAAALGWPLGTVKKRLQLGLRKLERRLSAERPLPASARSAERREA